MWCRRVEVDEILDLRHRLLRQGLPAEMARFGGDLDEGTRHYGVDAGEGEGIVCCLTLLPSTWQGAPAWQLRGMATETRLQGTGLGKNLVAFAVTDALSIQPAWVFWCNARVSAMGFYAGLGWTAESEEFDIAHAGPHLRMAWNPIRFS